MGTGDTRQAAWGTGSPYSLFPIPAVTIGGNKATDRELGEQRVDVSGADAVDKAAEDRV